MIEVISYTNLENIRGIKILQYHHPFCMLDEPFQEQCSRCSLERMLFRATQVVDAKESTSPQRRRSVTFPVMIPDTRLLSR